MRRRILLGTAGIVLAGMAVSGVLLVRVVQGAEASLVEKRLPELAALGHPVPAIVLGMGPGPDTPILDRAEVAALLWHRGHVSRFVTSGGQGSDESEPESRTLRTALVSMGVPGERITEENASTSTRENLAFSRPLLVENGALPEPIIVVTHDFHAHRTETLARAAGYAPVLVTTEGTRLRYRRLRMLREVVALVRSWFAGLMDTPDAAQ